MDGADLYQIQNLVARYGHAQLLTALTLLVIVDPFLSTFVGEALLDSFLVLTLFSAIFACANTRRNLVIGVSLATAMLITLFVHNRIVSNTADVALSLLGIVFFGYVIALVLASVFRDSRRVSADTICGALSVYLLLGLLWAFAFALLESAAPGSFSGVDDGASFTRYKRFLGFSFVTLTTLGYGNVVPLTPRADALAVSNAIVGQLYLTVLVARFVALNLIHGAEDRES
jgi:hypothetical protein